MWWWAQGWAYFYIIWLLFSLPHWSVAHPACLFRQHLRHNGVQTVALVGRAAASVPALARQGRWRGRGAGAPDVPGAADGWRHAGGVWRARRRETPRYGGDSAAVPVEWDIGNDDCVLCSCNSSRKNVRTKLCYCGLSDIGFMPFGIGWCVFLCIVFLAVARANWLPNFARSDVYRYR